MRASDPMALTRQAMANVTQRLIESYRTAREGLVTMPAVGEEGTRRQEVQQWANMRDNPYLLATTVAAALNARPLHPDAPIPRQLVESILGAEKSLQQDIKAGRPPERPLLAPPAPAMQGLAEGGEINWGGAAMPRLAEGGAVTANGRDSLSALPKQDPGPLEVHRLGREQESETGTIVEADQTNDGTLLYKFRAPSASGTYIDRDTDHTHNVTDTHVHGHEHDGRPLHFHELHQHGSPEEPVRRAILAKLRSR
jgi:hypothetical protein